MRTIGTSLFTFVVAAGAFGAGCSWTAFDNLADETWVDRSTAPAGTDSSLFGEVVVAGGVHLPGGGAALAVLGRNKASISRLAFDAQGTRTELGGGNILDSLQIGSLPESPAAAGDPGSSRIAFAMVSRNTLANDPLSNTKFAIYDAGTADLRLIKQFDTPPDLLKATQADGLAFASLTAADGTTLGEAGKTELIVARGNQVMVITDWEAAEGSTFAVDSCLIQAEWSFGITSGDVDATTPGKEIILATGSKDRLTEDAHLKVFTPQTVLDAYPGSGPAGDCFTTTNVVLHDITAAGVKDLGAQLVVADFGSGPLLIASAPQSNRIYVYQDSMPLNPIEAPLGASAFGDALAVGDLDGDGFPELIVGAPKTNIDNVSDAGAAFVFKLNTAGTGFDQLAILHDSTPESSQHYGKSVAVVPFGADPAKTNILAVGAEGEVFTYFRTQLYSDVRTGRK